MYPKSELFIFAGNRFDSQKLLKYAQIYNLKSLTNRMHFVIDLGIEMNRMFIADFPKGGLKPLAKHFGFNWSSGLNGEECAYYFTEYQLNKEEPEIGWDSLKEYNKDDVMALWTVIEKFNSIKLSKY